jgi:hypothetical protein
MANLIVADGLSLDLNDTSYVFPQQRKAWSSEFQAPARRNTSAQHKWQLNDSIDPLLPNAGPLVLNTRAGEDSTTIVNFPTSSDNGVGARLFMDPNRQAFRAGGTTGAQWDWNASANPPVQNRGMNSIGLGIDTTASGAASVSIGDATTASAPRSFALGNAASATHDNAFVWSGFTSTAVPIVPPAASLNPDEVTFGARGGFRLLGAGADDGAHYVAGDVYLDTAGAWLSGGLKMAAIATPAVAADNDTGRFFVGGSGGATVPMFQNASGASVVLGAGAFDNSAGLTKLNPGAPDTGAGNDYVFGPQALATDGSRFLFYNTKHAFRAGTTTGGEWADAMVGVGSVAFASDNVALGLNSFVAGGTGSSTAAGGTNATAIGSGHRVSANNALALGAQSTVTHANALVWSDSTARNSGAANEVTFSAKGGFRVLGIAAETAGYAAGQIFLDAPVTRLTGVLDVGGPTAPNATRLESAASDVATTRRITLPALAPTAAGQTLATGNDFAVANTLTWLSPLTAINQQVFGASGTYTPTAGMKFCIVEGVGGGGGGGGAATTSIAATEASVGGGGGAGSYGRAMFTAALIGPSRAVTVGTGGAGGQPDATPATAGTSTVLLSLLECPGGSPGTQQTGTPYVFCGPTGLGAVAFATGQLGALFQIEGQAGGGGMAWATLSPALAVGFGGAGGSSFIASGPPSTVFSLAGTNGRQAGLAGQNGAGGAGGAIAASNFPSLAGVSGGAGGNGSLIITEYA